MDIGEGRIINDLNCLSNGLIFVMLITVNEMTTNVEKQGNEQKVISWLVREGWRNGEIQ